MTIARRTVGTLVALACGLTLGQMAAAADAPATLPLVAEENFESGADRWLPTDPAAWRLDESNGNHVFTQFQQSKYQPPHRSPFNIARLKDVTVSDFQFDVDLLSTARDYDHRSLCLIFGYQDPAHFYYVHMGKRTDDHANQIFIVNDAPRTKISSETTAGTPWDDQWHHVRITRNAKSGEIAVYFDDLETPIMRATDATFTWGQVGIGSFDDMGQFDNIELRGTVVEGQ